MTNEFPKPDNNDTPNYYGGGVPSNPVQPQPDSNPYADPHYSNPAQQAPFNPAQQQQPYAPAQPAYNPAQQPYGAPQQFNGPYAPQANQANPYQQQMPYSGMPVTAPQNKNGIISLVSALITLFVLWVVPVIGTVAAIVAVVFGHKSLKETQGANQGRGTAIAGVICGYVSLALSLFWIGFLILMVILGAAAEASTY